MDFCEKNKHMECCEGHPLQGKPREFGKMGKIRGKSGNLKKNMSGKYPGLFNLFYDITNYRNDDIYRYDKNVYFFL